MKVKLVFAKNNYGGLVRDAFSREVDIELPQGFEHVHLEGARCYDPNQRSDEPSGDTNATIWNFEDESRLVGKLLTYVDATFTDLEQRKAHKDIVKDIVYSFCQDVRTRGIQTVDAYQNK